MLGLLARAGTFIGGLWGKSIAKFGLGKTIAGTAVVGAGTVTAGVVDVAANGTDGLIGGGIEGLQNLLGEPSARSQANIATTGFFAFIEQIGRVLSEISKGMGLDKDLGISIQNWARGAQHVPPLTKDTFNNPQITVDTDGDGTPDAPAPQPDPRAPKEGIGYVLHTSADAAFTTTNQVVTGGVGAVVDFFDDMSDDILGVVGIDTGAEHRNLSQAWTKAVDNAFHDNVMARADLTTGFGAVAKGFTDIGSWFIPFGTAANLLSLSAKGANNLQTTGNIMQPGNLEPT